MSRPLHLGDHRPFPGPGDLWHPPEDDPFGDCDDCGTETYNIVDQGVDADEDGVYGWIIFRCDDCQRKIDDPEDDEEDEDA